MRSRVAMHCPECGGEVNEAEWLCPFCEHILDPSAIDGISWEPEPGEPPAEAMILGSVAVVASEFSVIRGPGTTGDGRTSTFLFYTSSATSRIIHPDAVPRLTHTTPSIPQTPFEDFVVSCIDGKRSVRIIRKVSGLAPQEVAITLLTLLDKGTIRIRREDDQEAEDPHESVPQQESETSTDPNVAISQPREGRDLEDLPLENDFYEVPLPHTEVLASPTIVPAITPRPRPVRARLRSSSSVSADQLIEAEELLAVVPRDLDASDAEMITDPSVSSVGDAQAPTKEPPILDPSFLFERPPSSAKLKPVPETSAEALSDVPATLAPPHFDSLLSPEPPSLHIAESPPIQKRSTPPKAMNEANRRPAMAPVRSQARIEERRQAPGPKEEVDGIRMMKAQKLFNQALKDKAEGKLVSARMNMKLAMTFDPTNELHREAFDELNRGGEKSAGANASSKVRSFAREHYDRATRAEEAGDVDLAIECLEKAIQESKQAAFYNRLGVIFAMKKSDFRRAQKLIETALELAPDNATYHHNLGKVLAMAATRAANPSGQADKRSRLFGALLRKKR